MSCEDNSKYPLTSTTDVCHTTISTLKEQYVNNFKISPNDTVESVVFRLTNVLGEQYQHELKFILKDIYHRVIYDSLDLDHLEEIAWRYSIDLKKEYDETMNLIEDDDELEDY